jgi:DNA ligase-1
MFAKLTSKGKVCEWSGRVGDDSTLFLEWGQTGGKMQTKVKRYVKGKNVGRKNETTPMQQAIAELESLQNSKRDGGYVLIPDDTENIVKYLEDNKTVVSRPMLANEYAKHKGKLPEMVYVQPKLDGVRCVANVRTGELFSRRGKEIKSLPHVSRKILDTCFGDDVKWVDGELYAHGLGFQSITGIVSSKKKIHDDAKKINLHIYDVISREGFGQRFDIPKSYNDVVRTEHIQRDEIDVWHKLFKEDSYEGTMIRYGDDGYEEGKRSSHLLKYKDFRQEEYTIVGFNCEKNNEELLGSVVLVDSDGKRFSARPAFTKKEKAEMWSTRDKQIGKTATVKFFELTDDGVPRFPVLVGVREDCDM